MKTTSYWLAQPLPQAVIPQAVAGQALGPVDVVVIGGGVTGCSCALTLARSGRRVRLLEARGIASGASGRNGGFALRGLAPAYDAVRDALGADTAAALWALTEQALDRMESLAGDALRRTGSLRLACDEAELDALRREHRALREDGFDAAWLDAAWLETVPGLSRPAYIGGLVHPRDGALSPALWVRRLAAHAAGAGVEIVERHPVDRASLDELEADAVVVAVDGWTPALLPELEPFVRATRGQMLATEPQAELRYERPYYARHGYDYWQQLGDGRLILGGRRDASPQTEDTAVDETTPLIQSELERLAAELLGHPPRVTHRWSGIWGETPDLLPLAGRLPGDERIWVAGGYSGHGNVVGFACGELVARALLGDERAELACFDPDRLRP